MIVNSARPTMSTEPKERGCIPAFCLVQSFFDGIRRLGDAVLDLFPGNFTTGSSDQDTDAHPIKNAFIEL